MGVGYEDRHRDQWNRTGTPDTNLDICGQMIFNKVVMTIQWRKKNVLNKWCWEQWLSMQMNEVGPDLTPCTEINLKDQTSKHKSPNCKRFRRKCKRKTHWKEIPQWFLRYDTQSKDDKIKNRWIGLHQHGKLLSIKRHNPESHNTSYGMNRIQGWNVQQRKYTQWYFNGVALWQMGAAWCRVEHNIYVCSITMLYTGNKSHIVCQLKFTNKTKQKSEGNTWIRWKYLQVISGKRLICRIYKELLQFNNKWQSPRGPFFLPHLQNPLLCVGLSGADNSSLHIPGWTQGAMRNLRVKERKCLQTCNQRVDGQIWDLLMTSTWEISFLGSFLKGGQTFALVFSVDAPGMLL